MDSLHGLALGASHPQFLIPSACKETRLDFKGSQMPQGQRIDAYPASSPSVATNGVGFARSFT